MKRFYKYELLDVVEDGPVTTYSAKEIASGRPVLVHMLTNALDAERRDSLLEKARAVATKEDTGEPAVLEAGQYVGFRYVVTDVVEASTGFLAWLSEYGGESAEGVAATEQVSSPEDGLESLSVASMPALPAAPSAPQEEMADPPAHPQLEAVAGQSGEEDAPAEEDTQQAVETAPVEPSPADQAFAPREAEDEVAVPGEARQTDVATSEQNEGATLDAGESGPEFDQTEAEPQEQVDAAKWLGAAQQFLETRAFGDALHALEQVLQVDPNDVEALRLQAEVRRREAEGQETATAAAERAPAVEAVSTSTPTNAAESNEEKALMLLSEGQELCSEGRADEGLLLLRQAHEVDQSNSLVTLVLANSLMQRAKSLSGSDWEAVDRLAGELLDLQPSHPGAQTLRRQAVAGAKLQRVSRCHEAARRIKSQGDIESALEAIAEGLRRDPGAVPLVALQKELDGAGERAARSSEQEVRESLEADRALDTAPTETESVETEATETEAAETESLETPAQPETTQLPEQREETVETSQDSTKVQELEDTRPVLKRYRRVEREDSGETPSEAVSKGPKDAPAVRSRPVDAAPEAPAAPKGSTEMPAVEAATPVQRPKAAPPISKPRTRKASRRAAKSKPARQPGVKVPLVATSAARRVAAASQTGKRYLQQVVPKARGMLDVALSVIAATLKDRRKRLWLLGGLAGLLVLASVLMIRQSRDASAGPAVATYRVRIESQPPGAAILVNGTDCGTSACETDLAAGNHQVTARLAGYMPATLSFGIDAEIAEERNPMIVTLSPLMPVLRITSNLGRGQVLIDGQDAGHIEEGEFEIELASLSPGAHSLRIVERDTAATIPFEVAPGTMPTVVGPIQTRNLKTVVVTGLGEDARVYSSESGEARLGENKVGTLNSEGLPLSNLAEGSHELSIGTGKEQQRVVLDATQQPTLAAFLTSDRNVGSLRVLAGEDDAAIYLNGQEYRHKTRRGARLIYLYPKKYTVRVGKKGYQAPPEQVAEIRKGEEVRLTFELAPQPQAATLQLRDSVPGAQVWLDGDSIGTVRPDGSLTASNIEPGKHHIRIEMLHYRAKQWEQEFAGGAKVEVDGALESSVGTLRVQVVPENLDVRLKLRAEGAAGERTISETTQFLPPGTYTVVASAEGYQDYGATVHLEINENELVRLSPKRVVEQQVQQPTVRLDDWEKAGGWQRQGKLLVRRGGDIVLAPGGSGRGEYIFTATVMRGGGLQWVVAFGDSGNYLLCGLNKNQFQRVQMKEGKPADRFRTRHGVSLDEFVSVKAQVTADSVVHKVLRGEEWVVIDTFEQPGAAFDRGKFGFRLSGRDEIGLSFFNFQPWN